jgi:septal ring factor EnvC (AmiA/AmiB activator)
MPMPGQFIAQILVLVLLEGVVFADVKDDLKGINSQIREKQKLLKQTKKAETKVSTELVQIDKSLREKESNLQHLGNELKVVETGISRTQQEIQLLVAELDKRKQQIAKRVSSVYKAGEMGNLRMFFSSESIPEVLENRRYMQSVLNYDRKLFQDYQGRLAQLQVMKTSLEREADKKEKLREKIRLKKKEIEDEKSRKSTHLSQIRQEKKSYQVSLKELQANARRLQSMVERLEARSRKSYTLKSDKKPVISGNYPQPPVTDKGFGSQRGRLSKPVSGEIVSRFGKHKHPEFNSFTFNNGISIAAPMNADIHAVFDGEVIFADSFKGYGNMLIIDHGGGYFSLYAHTARINKKVGATVRKNETVAQVGDSDSTSGAQLYFEIRYQGKPIDPGPWLR